MLNVTEFFDGKELRGCFSRSMKKRGQRGAGKMDEEGRVIAGL